MLMISTISECLEDVMNTKIHDKWKLSFKDNSDFDNLIHMWIRVVAAIIPFNRNLTLALQGGLRNKKVVDERIADVKSIVASLRCALEKQLEKVIAEIER